MNILTHTLIPAMLIVGLLGSSFSLTQLLLAGGSIDKVIPVAPSVRRQEVRFWGLLSLFSLVVLVIGFVLAVHFRIFG